VAVATADGLRKVAEALRMPGGHEAMQLRIAEQYVTAFGNLAKSGTSMIVPANLTDISSVIATAMSAIKASAAGDPILGVKTPSRAEA